MNKPTVGFIGLGLMGNPMAKNILKKGFPLVVYNRTLQKTKELEKLGASVAKTPAELTTQSDIIITMVTKGADVEAVLFGKNGAALKAKPGTIVIDMSTIGPSFAITTAKNLAQHNIEFLDAPVTGSTPKAITGELTIFIGGKKEVFEKAKDVLLAMGTNLQYMGKVGNGQGMKLINNHLVAATIAALAEAMLLADAMKLSRKNVANTLKTVPAMSPFMNLKIPNFVDNVFPLLFSAANMKKDVSLAVIEAKKGLPAGRQGRKNLPLLTTVEKLYTKALKKKLGDKDMSIIIKVIT